MATEVEAKLVKERTRLKCPDCKAFYVDDGSVVKCLLCEKDLKQITVWNVMPTALSIGSGKPKMGGAK